MPYNTIEKLHITDRHIYVSEPRISSDPGSVNCLTHHLSTETIEDGAIITIEHPN